MNGNKRRKEKIFATTDTRRKIDGDKRDQRCFHFPHLVDFNLIYVWANLVGIDRKLCLSVVHSFYFMTQNDMTLVESST